jgi:hypothetical protein
MHTGQQTSEMKDSDFVREESDILKDKLWEQFACDRIDRSTRRMKLGLSLLILAAILLPSFAATRVDWVKAGVARVARAAFGRIKGPNAPQYLRVYAGDGVAGILHTGSDVVHGSDDFLYNEIGSSTNWVYVGATPLSSVAWQPGHQGIVSIPTGTTTSVNELIGKQVSTGPSVGFRGITKCVARFVVSCDALFTASGGFDGEWYLGIANPDGTGNVYAGALLSFAPGFDGHPSKELLAGSYTSQGSHTETPTNFRIAPNTWYDLIISWTPTVIKYYAAVYGQIPTLIATNTTNISREPQYLLIGNNRYKNGGPSVTLLIDKAEWLYTTSQETAYLSGNLLKF